MQLTETKLKGAFVIDLEQRQDSRGFFARTFCARNLLSMACSRLLPSATFRSTTKLERCGNAINSSGN